MIRALISWSAALSTNTRSMSTRDLQAIGASDERSSTRARCYLQLNLETDLIRLRRLLPQRQSRPCRDRSISSIRRACGKGARSLLCGWLQAHCGGRREPLQPHCGGRGQNPCGRTAEAGEKPLQSHCGRTAGGAGRSCGVSGGAVRRRLRIWHLVDPCHLVARPFLHTLRFTQQSDCTWRCGRVSSPHRGIPY